MRPNFTIRRCERGYILLTLVLFVALLTIAAVAIAPTITFQVKRDREEELIHRGVQYSRAVRRYVKKFGRYPTRIEELENTNNLRFLRKRYKDPVTGKDFKMLHLGEVQLAFGAGIAGASPVGANPANGALGGQTGLQGGVVRGLSGPSGPGTQETSGEDTTQADAGPGSQPNQSGDKLSSQVFGGGPIVGVTSTSKAQTIREFNKKNHYNQWQFIYDPSSDRGGLLNAPAQPPLQGVTPNLPGIPGMQGQPTPQNPPATQPPPQ
jgi:type II secretory pathway pseudopilin PulG